MKTVKLTKCLPFYRILFPRIFLVPSSRECRSEIEDWFYSQFSEYGLKRSRIFLEMDLGRVNTWISHQSIFLAEIREERGWIICFKLCSYHVALNQWFHRSKLMTVSDVQDGVCKELYATFEIAELRVNKQFFHYEMSNQWNAFNHYPTHKDQSPICGVLKFVKNLFVWSHHGFSQ